MQEFYMEDEVFAGYEKFAGFSFLHTVMIFNPFLGRSFHSIHALATNDPRLWRRAKTMLTFDGECGMCMKTKQKIECVGEGKYTFKKLKEGEEPLKEEFTLCCNCFICCCTRCYSQFRNKKKEEETICPYCRRQYSEKEQEEKSREKFKRRTIREILQIVQK
eukprot:761438-Rhodomonas_salina.2